MASEAASCPPAGFPLDDAAGPGHPAAAHAGQNLARRVGRGARPWSRRSASCAGCRPRVVVVLGGYASVAVRVGAVAVRGSRWCVHRAERPRRRAPTGSAAASPRRPRCPFAGTDLPRAVVTGNPSGPRSLADRAVPTATGRGAGAELGLPADRTVVAVFSGSLGSRAHQRRRARAAPTCGATAHDLADPPRGRARDFDRRVAAAQRRPAGRRARLPARRATRTAWSCCSPPPTWSCRAAGGTRGRAGRRRAARDPRAAADRAQRPPDRATPRASSAAGAAVLVPDDELRRRPARHGARRVLDARSDRLRGDGARAARTLGPTRRRRPGRRPRRGARAWLTALGLDLTHASLAVHVVGVGGAGMSAIAIVLAGMGHHVSGSDLKASAGLERLRALGVTVHVGHDAGQRPADVDAVAISTAIPERNPEVRRGPPSAGIPVLRRAEMLAAIAATRRTVAVAGTHGKTTTSSMLALVLREAGLRPSFVIGGDVNEVGTGAVWGDGDRLRGRGRRERRHLPRARRAAPSSSPTSSPTTSTTTAASRRSRRRSTGSSPRRPGPRVLCADDERGRRAGARASARVTYGTAAEADYRIVDVRGGRGVGPTSPSCTDGRRAGPRSPAARRRPQRRATPPPPGRGAGARRAVRGGGGRARPLRRAWPAASSTGARPRGVTFVDDYAHLPTEVAGRARPRPRGRLAPGRRASSSRTATAAPRRSGADFADAFGGADVLVLTDVYAAGEAPRPGVSGKLVVDAVLDAHPWQRVAYLPRRADLVGYLAGELRPGDLCSRWAPATSRSLPDEVLARLRPGGRSRERRRPRLGRPARRRGPARDVPLGPLDHLPRRRPGGAWSVEVADADELAERRPCRARHGRPHARGREGLEPARGRRRASPASRSLLGDRLRRDRPDGAPCVRAGAAVQPAGAGPPHRGRGAHRARVGGRRARIGRRRGAHERRRARLRHGRHPRRGSASSTCATGEDGEVPASALDLGYRRSALASTQVVVCGRVRPRGRRPRPRPRRARATSCAGGASTSRVARTPARCSPTRPATRRAGSSTAAGAKGLRVGSAEVSPKHANFIQADDGRQRPTTCSR